jgi:hypothetical protein
MGERMKTHVLITVTCLVLGVLNSELSGQEPGAIEKTVIAHEKQLWEAFKQKDAASISKLLADDYLEVLSNKRIDKAGILKIYKTFDIRDYQMADIKVILLGKEAAVLTYKRTLEGKSAPAGPVYVTSVWARRDNRWVVVLYQETRYRETR